MNEPVALAAVVAVVAVTAVLGVRGLRVAKTPADFLVAAREVQPALNASAISGEYLSAASFLGVAGLAMQQGVGALWYAVGYGAGYLVLLVVVAAPLRRFGAYTIPDFAEGRLDSHRLRRAATVMVLVICGFYTLPQLKGAGITLQEVLGSPYWVGVVVLGCVVTIGIASGGMRGITVVQAFQFWLKIMALSIPALVLLAVVHHQPYAVASKPVPATFSRPTEVRFPDRVVMDLDQATVVVVQGKVDGKVERGQVHLGPGAHQVAAGSAIVFPKAAAAPGVESAASLSGSQWASPLVRLNGLDDHPLAATYGVILATFFGALGLPHILVRFYTNPDGQSARRTTSLVLLLLSCFYVFPPVFAFLGRLDAPGLYASAQTDTVVLALPALSAHGAVASVLGALVTAGAFAAFLSTTSGLLIAMSGAISHDIFGRGQRAFRASAVGAGMLATAGGLIVAGFSINILVGWAFAIAASSFCPLLVLGIWWPRLTWVGALAGLVLGGGAASAAVVASMVGAGRTGWAAVLLGVPAVWTVPLAFCTMIGVSLATGWALPANVTQKLLALHLPEEVRRPFPARSALKSAPRSAPGSLSRLRVQD